ncbi:MAG: nitrogen regulation protein NR(II) [Gammaproteobacteria bacterium]|jgi:two-component system nitrogen regulation sensor histidine kinase GlnL
MDPEREESVRFPFTENLATGVLVLRPNLEVEYLNPAAEQLLGTSKMQLAGRIIDQGVPALAVLRPLFERAIETGEGIARRELSLEISRPTSSPTTVDCTLSLVTTRDDEVLLVAEFSDASHRLRISRENSLLSQLEVSRAMVRQLAHEIRNPLGGIRGAAQLLERKLGIPDLQEYTRLIIREADRLAQLTSTMLGPGDEPARQLHNIHELVEHVYHLLRAEAPPAMDIGRDYDPSLPELFLDRGQVVQAMLNLARNAMQAVGEGGAVIFRTRALTHYTVGGRMHRLVASVEVEDNGPGVPDALRDSLFYPLVSGRAGGSGLGLALAQDLVTRQGGIVEYSSTPKRTVFQMLFPIEEVHASQAS